MIRFEARKTKSEEYFWLKKNEITKLLEPNVPQLKAQLARHQESKHIEVNGSTYCIFIPFILLHLVLLNSTDAKIIFPGKPY